MTHPLESLLAPLKIAARDPNRVRGLEQVVASLRERTGPGQPQDEIAALARGFDDRPEDERRERIRRMARALATVVGVPPELLGPEPATASGAGTGLPLSALPGIGPARAAAFAKRGLHTVGDLLFFLPNRYEDRRRVTTIRDVPWTGRVVVVGKVTRVEVKRVRGGRKLLEATIADETGSLDAVWFNFYPSLPARLERPPGLFVLSGEVRRGFKGRRQIAHPDLEEMDPEGMRDSYSFGRIVPVYGEVEGVYPKQLRRILWRVLEEHAPSMPDLVPPEVRARNKLVPLLQAIVHAHFPPADASLDALLARASPAHERLIFDELFFLQLGLALKKRGVKIAPGFSFDTSPRILEWALARLPFRLTGAQRRAVDDILRDMARPEPMNRLLQGDVGSGKTAVALVAMLVAVANKKQAALMAPTELLAEQHARTLSRLLSGTGLEPPLLSASAKGKEAERVRARLRDGSAPLVVGTHALLSEGVDFADLGLVVIDEQHRFGVVQRAVLIQKGRRPDVLVMTATPIPRTLAMTLYGDLDVSVIDELPPGRTPVTTRVWNMQRQREQVYQLVRKELSAGRQAYIVLPLVEESEAEELKGIRDAVRTFEELSRGPLREFRLGLVHGRLSARERDVVMERFRAGALDALVATTVIEVGVDVPNASVMVVEHAERFGLSQLHQLRGRVGRGAAKSYCHLVAGDSGDKARSRLAVMARTQDGFKISEEDLAIRGPGELIGTKQSGLPDLAIASLGRDQKILERARREAFALVERDPKLSAPEHRALGKEVLARWGGRLSLGRVG